MLQSSLIYFVTGFIVEIMKSQKKKKNDDRIYPEKLKLRAVLFTYALLIHIYVNGGYLEFSFFTMLQKPYRTGSFLYISNCSFPIAVYLQWVEVVRFDARLTITDWRKCVRQYCRKGPFSLLLVWFFCFLIHIERYEMYLLRETVTKTWKIKRLWIDFTIPTDAFWIWNRSSSFL